MRSEKGKGAPKAMTIGNGELAKTQSENTFDGLRFLSAVMVSQMVIKENPRKRPRDPPNSATRDCQG